MLKRQKKYTNYFVKLSLRPRMKMRPFEILKGKKNRIILIQKDIELPFLNYRTALNGVLSQEKDSETDQLKDLQQATSCKPTDKRLLILFLPQKYASTPNPTPLFWQRISNFCASGTGQTSRVDALNQAIVKANHFNFDLKGAVMASDAFFPFPDCVEIADKAGIASVIQPGGSIKDQLSIDYCDET